MLGGHVNAYVCLGIGEMKEKNSLSRTLATFENKRLEGLPDIPHGY